MINGGLISQEISMLKLLEPVRTFVLTHPLNFILEVRGEKAIGGLTGYGYM
jgi:hypothetical protein